MDTTEQQPQGLPQVGPLTSLPSPAGAAHECWQCLNPLTIDGWVTKGGRDYCLACNAHNLQEMRMDEAYERENET